MKTQATLLFAASVAATALLSGCSVSSVQQVDAQKDLAEATTAAQNGNAVASHTWCDRAIAVDPKSVDLYVGPNPNDPNAGNDLDDGQRPTSILEVYSAVNDDPSIVTYLLQATQKFPGDWRPWLDLADSDERLGKTADQQAAAKQAAAIMEQQVNKPGAGSTSDRVNRLATAYYLAGNFAKAKSTLQSAIAAFPADPVALNDLAYFIADSNDVADLPLALTDANLALSKLRSKANLDDDDDNVDEATFEDTLGWVEYRQHNFTQAVATLQNAVSAVPAMPEVRYHLGMAYLGLDGTTVGKGDIDNHAAARAELGSALAMNPAYAAPQQALAKLGPASVTATSNEDEGLL